MVADHHVGLAAPQRPHGQPPVLFGKVEQGTHHFCCAFRAKQGVEGVRGAVGVPKREGGIIARRGAMYLAVGTGIEAVGIAVKRGREQCVVKRGVKRSAFVGRAAFHLDFPQSFVPSRLGRLAVRLEIIVRRFCREVFLCTFRTSRREGGDDGQQSLVAEVVKLEPRLDCRPRAPPVRHDRHAVYVHARIGVGKAGLEKHALPPRPPF